METYAAIFLPMLLCARHSYGYPGGAPDMSCLSMSPTGHGVSPMTTEPPYRVMVTKESYKPGETLQVTVHSSGENYFRGLLLQARVTGCGVNETRLLGMFTVPDSELETKHCFGIVHSAVTHNSAKMKRMKTFHWTAPVVTSGHVVMRATVVREFQEYWTNVDSSILTDTHAAVSPKCLPTYLPAPPARPSLKHGQDVMSGYGWEKAPGSQGDEQDDKGSLSGDQKEKDKAGNRMPSPSWLGAGFDHSTQAAIEDGGERLQPSWLVPDYQRAVSSTDSAARAAIHSLLLLFTSFFFSCLA